MPNPLISIIIPVYNHAKELQKTLESVFGQTLICHPEGSRQGGGPKDPVHKADGILRGVYPFDKLRAGSERSRRTQNDRAIEVIVVDDGSEKSQIHALRQIEGSNLKSQILPKYPQVKFIFTEHCGAAAARNRGFRESQGQYVIFWDADIVSQPEMLEKMKKALDEHPEASYVYSSFKFGWKTFECGPFDSERLKKANYITTTSLIRREHFPGFDESLKKFQDWDMWLTMLEQGHIGCWVPEVLFTVKPRQAGMSSWLPSFIYKFPWLPIPALKKYQYWKKVVLKKHGLI